MREGKNKKQHAEGVWKSDQLNRAKGVKGKISPCRVKGQRPLWGLGQRPNCSASNLLKGRSQQGAGSEASLPVTKKPCNTAQSAWEATAEGVQRAIGKPSGSCSFYHYNRKVNSGSAKSSLTFYCCRGISRLRARPKGMKTNEVCDRPLETFECTLPYLYWRVAYFLWLQNAFRTIPFYDNQIFAPEGAYFIFLRGDFLGA